MNVTIITDASYDNNLKVAGYGYWIVSDRGKKNDSGRIRGSVLTSISAEMMAVVNSLWVALKFEIAKRNDTVLIQTDCHPAISAFEYERDKNLNYQEIASIEVISKLRFDYNLTIKYRHVKGHSSTREPRYIVNNICDSMAYNELSKIRKRKRAKENN